MNEGLFGSDMYLTSRCFHFPTLSSDAQRTAAALSLALPNATVLETFHCIQAKEKETTTKKHRLMKNEYWHEDKVHY